MPIRIPYIQLWENELATPGYIVSDWYGIHSTVESANTGLDMEDAR